MNGQVSNFSAEDYAVWMKNFHKSLIYRLKSRGSKRLDNVFILELLDTY
jgi:hypothetical protein